MTDKKKWGFPSGAVVKSPPANTGHAKDMGSISGLGRSPGVKNGQPTPVFLPGNPMDSGAWRATVHGVSKTWT